VSEHKTHYEVLGVPRDATPDRIQRRYRELARRYHPDVAEDTALSHTLFAQVTSAYRVLRDPAQRAAYDRALAAPPPAPRPAPRPPAAPPADRTSPPPRRPPERSPLESAGMERLLSEAEGDALAEAGQYERALAFYRLARGRSPNPPLEAKIARLEGALREAASREETPREDEGAGAPVPAEGDRRPFWRRWWRGAGGG